MTIRNVSRAIVPVLFVTVFLFWAGICSAADLLVNDSDFKSPDEVWGFIPDYSDMAEGDSTNWIWIKPGVSLTQYKTVEVPLFENISRETDVTAQDLLTRNMKDGLSRRLGMKVVDKGADITVKGAMVDYSRGSTATRIWIGYGAGEPYVEVEVYVVDNKTNEIISKVRHQALDSTTDSAIAETISDIINDWARR